MFGTLSPRRCALIDEDRQGYQRFYCGLCKTLGDRYGTLSRPLVGDDAVFLALLVDALSEDAAARGSCRCPMLPIVHKETIAPTSVAMRFAVGCQMLLGDQWLADRAVEGKRLARLLRPLARSYVERAHAELDALGVSFRGLDDFGERQATAERAAHDDPELAVLAASRPTEDALRQVFAAIAGLPGVIDASAAVLGELGAALGRVIYLTDALLDLEDDAAEGAFNPALRAGRVDPARVHVAALRLRDAIVKVRSIRCALAVGRHGAILDSVLTLRLPEQAERAIVAAQGLVARLRRGTTRPQRAGGLARWGLPLLSLLLFVVSWIAGLRDARAGTAKQMAAPRPLGPSASASPGTPPLLPSGARSVAPDLPPLAPSLPSAPPANDNGAPSASPSASAAPSASGSPGPSGPGAPACTACTDACQSCTQGCVDSCNHCSSCKCPCDGCADSCGRTCSGVCSSCPKCNDCCSSCKSCGDCGTCCKDCNCKGCDCKGCCGR